MKAYTDIEQSKKLVEILPLESADMHYHYDLDFDEGVEKARSEMKSEPQTVTFIDSGTERIVDKLLMLEISVDAINQLQIKEHQRLFEALNKIIGKLCDIHQVLSKPCVFPYRDYAPPREPWYEIQQKTHGVERVPPVTCETTNEIKAEDGKDV